jgi:hypothetical protein
VVGTVVVDELDQSFQPWAEVVVVGTVGVVVELGVQSPHPPLPHSVWVKVAVTVTVLGTVTVVGTTTVVGTVTVLGAGQLGTTVFRLHEVTVDVLYMVGQVLVVVVVEELVQSFQPLVEVVAGFVVEVVLL